MPRFGSPVAVWFLVGAFVTDAACALPPRITADEFRLQSMLPGLVDNVAFTPPPGARPARATFIATLRLSETEMPTAPREFKSREVQGRDPRLFPSVSLTFFTQGDDLVPVNEQVIRSGTNGVGRSYWDVIVQPGKVWSESADGGWSRAAFPFALVNSLEGETHNGLAMFRFRRGEVSPLRFQIVQQTAPFNVTDYFTASGLIPTQMEAAPISNLDELRRRYSESVEHRLRIASWADLARKVGAARLEGFDGDVPAQSRVLSGLDFEGTFYLKECNSAAGPLPWCDRARFGVWSMTKSLVNETALLRLVQKFGAAVLSLKIADYVPQLQGRAGWESVSFQDAVNMATGMGNGRGEGGTANILDGGLDRYADWYQARSLQEKLAGLTASAVPYPWGSGKVARYRDQDAFLLGVAMNNLLRSKSPGSSLWSMLRKEVFEPIGIDTPVMNTTIENDGSDGQPLMAFGFFPTVGDVIKLARLFQARGEWNGQQILYSPKVREILLGGAQAGFATGSRTSAGEIRYADSFWRLPFDSTAHCRAVVPRMQGWGASVLALMPNGMSGIQLANVWEESGNSESVANNMLRVSDAMKPLCSRLDLDAFDGLRKQIALPNGETLAYLEIGNPLGRPVVLIHGYTDSARDWLPLIPYLSQDVRLILIDIRGHGQSSKPECCYARMDFAYDVKLLLDALKIPVADLVGHSLGSMIAQSFAEFWPERTGRVVLISSTGGPRKNGAQAVPEPFDYRSPIAKLTDPIDPESAFMIEWYASPSPVDPEFLRRQRRDAAAIPVRVWLAVLDQTLTDLDLQATLPRFKAPVLLIWGSDDAIFGEELRSTLREGLPQAKVKIFDKLGHNPFWEDPQAVARSINSFLTEVR